ncbi:hypothetical protein KY284_017158 [Solanum tuberosum]|nr:hypothetical protein KY284_017158 [Solanum tuberosum]
MKRGCYNRRWNASIWENMKKYYGKEQPLNLIINVKHTTKLPGEKRREEYRVLDLKQKLTTDRIFVPYHL